MTGPPQYFKQFERKKSAKDKLDFASKILAKLAKFQVYEDAKDAGKLPSSFSLLTLLSISLCSPPFQQMHPQDNFFDKIMPLLESDLIDAASGHDAFIASLVTIARGYSKALTPEAEEEEGFFFHESYEKALILIVGMMENSSCLKVFFETLRSQDLIVPFSQALGSMLPLDISYTTQVVHTSSLLLTYSNKSGSHMQYLLSSVFFPCSRRLHWIFWHA